MRELQDQYRLYALDMIGYGDSDTWPEDKPFDPMADVKALHALQTIIGEPVLLVGHSYGGAVTLEFARLHRQAIIKLVLIEPVAFHLLFLGNAVDECDEVIRLSRAVTSAIADKDPVRAARDFMRFWGGRIRWWLMPKKMKQNVIATMGKVAKEFEIVEKVRPSLDEYKRIDMPVRLIVGGKTRHPASKVIEILSSLLPDAHQITLPGAGHMSPFTHRQEINRLIREFL